MRPRSLDQVAAAVDGSVRGDGEVTVRGAAVDSRLARGGDLFVALPGEQADGHDFVADALAHGASAAMVRRGWRGEAEPTVRVADPGAALLRLARDERSALSVQVVGITGSTGKTMTKDLTAAVLRRRFRVVASPASYMAATRRLVAMNSSRRRSWTVPTAACSSLMRHAEPRRTCSPPTKAALP